MTDHAVRIDVLHGEGAALTSVVSDAFGKCAQGEHDTRQVMAFVQANDDVLHAQDAMTKVRIEEVMTQIGVAVLKLTTSQAGAYTELRELLLSFWKRGNRGQGASLTLCALPGMVLMVLLRPSQHSGHQSLLGLGARLMSL